MASACEPGGIFVDESCRYADPYLSSAPQGLRAALVTGGLPGLDARAEDV